MLPYAASSTRQMIAASQGADAIVGLSFAVGAAIAAERLSLPHVAVSLQPTTVFSAYDPPFLPRVPWLRPAGGGLQLWLNRITLALGRQTTAPWTRRINHIRRDLGVGPAKGDIFFDALAGADLALGLYSPVLSQRQPDARSNFHVVGYAPYDSEAGGPPTLPEPLRRFLDDGEPPLVFTLGSAVVNIAGDFYRQSLRAARSLGRRSVLLVGPGGDLGAADGPDTIGLPYAPYSLLFPRAAAVAHQGGVGTTQQALRAGRPQLVVPHLGDQHDNAARVQRLGCGLALNRRRYPARAEDALSRLLHPSRFSLRAEAVGARTRDEDGASAAAERIAGLVG
jgi:UDP:flavonoid glycosyltransferase YjiC (YdhE family)